MSGKMNDDPSRGSAKMEWQTFHTAEGTIVTGQLSVELPSPGGTTRESAALNPLGKEPFTQELGGASLMVVRSVQAAQRERG